jgi:hypothetical protein
MHVHSGNRGAWTIGSVSLLGLLALGATACSSGPSQHPSLGGAVFDAGTHSQSSVDKPGASVYATAELNGGQTPPSGTPAPTGTVTYSFYDGSNCSGTAISSQTVTISGGKVPDSGNTAPLAAGTHSVNLAYSGDSTYFAASTCSPF